MSKKLSLKFDPNQQYQLDAISAVVDLFQGFNFYAQEDQFRLGGTDEIVANLPEGEELYHSILISNLNEVQARQTDEKGTPILQPSLTLELDQGLGLDGTDDEPHEFPGFTVEMETGTGKTYCYLRTIYELRQRYGFSKFIIIVPSVAIFEGVLKTEQITRDHFRSLYGNQQVTVSRYDGARPNRVRIFATDTQTHVLVMTLDSFNKISNNLYKASEKLQGELLPYQYIQRTRPIVILDEPQSLDNTEKARQAIRTLRPLFGLRYSATHRTSPNLVYRLTPVEAYRQGLVKKIEVIGITETDDVNLPTLALEKVTPSPITAHVRTLSYEKGQTVQKVIKLKQGENLHKKTKREEHANGHVVREINISPGREFVEFENGQRIQLAGQLTAEKPEIFAGQIEETIKAHFAAQARLKARGIKVLTLFFLDRVANYTSADGMIRKLFDQAFDQLKQTSDEFKQFSAEQVRDAYFAKAKAKGEQFEQAIDTSLDESKKTKDEKEAERAAFELIMRNKERLLSFDEPVSFIFAHSALREGWDNPNVFQICTFNETKSPIRKRQEIGRGLRLCVNQNGERITDDDVNILTVIPNDSYKSFCAKLQSEYLEEGDEAPPNPTRAKDGVARRRQEIYESADFHAFWQKLNRRTRYKIKLDVPRLIEECATALTQNAAKFAPPVIKKTKGRFIITQFEIRLTKVQDGVAWLWVQTKDTEGRLWFPPGDGVPVMKRQRLGAVLKRRLNNPAVGMMLDGYIVQEVIGSGDDVLVRFTNGQEVTLYKNIQLESEQGQHEDQEEITELHYTYPVFDFIGRAAQQTHLTRATLNQIFARFAERASVTIFRNPEGFTRTFIEIIKHIVSVHIAERIEFELQSGEAYDTEDLFPEVKKFPQKELVESGLRGLYDKTQWDSEVERSFVEQRLRQDENATVFFFKFPPKFKLDFPKIIGDYNPDWGIVRFDEAGTAKLHLVRETKGSTNLETLRFSHEALKVKCAQRYFNSLGIDYRVVDANVSEWWLSGELNESSASS